MISRKVEHGRRRNASAGLAMILEQVSVGEPVSWRRLEVFPSYQPNGHDPGYALIDDLLADGQAEITEISEHGHVPTIRVRNRSDRDGLILDGMELRGARQNRMVNVTIIVGKHAETDIPVSCVEQGRWSYRSKAFGSAGRTVANTLRRQTAQMVGESLARGRPAGTDQGRVWAAVEGYVRETDARSPTRALDDAFAEREAEIQGYVEALGGIDAFGAVVALNGKIVGFDLLDRRETFKKLWLMLLRGYAMDATINAEPTATPLPREGIEAWLRSVATSAKTTAHEVPGVSEYHAVQGPKITGGITWYNQRAVHVALAPGV